MPHSISGKVKCKAVVKKNECVACGSCVSQCPIGAVYIKNGSYAQIECERCVGCGKCKSVCPASIIVIGEVS